MRQTSLDDFCQFTRVGRKATGWERLTGNKKHDSCGEGTIESLKGGEVSEGEDACDDSRKTRHR